MLRLSFNCIRMSKRRQRNEQLGWQTIKYFSMLVIIAVLIQQLGNVGVVSVVLRRAIGKHTDDNRLNGIDRNSLNRVQPFRRKPKVLPKLCRWLRRYCRCFITVRSTCDREAYKDLMIEWLMGNSFHALQCSHTKHTGLNPFYRGCRGSDMRALLSRDTIRVLCALHWVTRALVNVIWLSPITFNCRRLFLRLSVPLFDSFSRESVSVSYGRQNDSSYHRHKFLWENVGHNKMTIWIVSQTLMWS